MTIAPADPAWLTSHQQKQEQQRKQAPVETDGPGTTLLRTLTDLTAGPTPTPAG